MKWNHAALLGSILLASGCALGQTTRPTATQPGATVPAATQPAPPDAPVSAATAPASTDPKSQAIDRLLGELEQVGNQLNSFIADVTLTETDALTASEFGRTGSVVFQRQAGGTARLRVNFERKIVGDRSQEHRVDYLLDDGWLVERDYRGKTEVRRQVLRPGQKLDLLKLGEGPFPLPIGQEVSEVHRLFEVTMPPRQPDDLPNTDHLRLVPRQGSQFSKRFQSIDVWVDRTTHMPIRIQTLDANGDVLRTTELTHLQLNPAVVAARFELPPIDASWNRHEEPFSE